MPSWTYDVSLTTAKDRVRFYAGDTIQNQAWIYDEEIEAMLLLRPNELLCAADILDSQSAQSSGKVSYSIGGGSAIRIDLSQRAIAFAQRAKELRRRAYKRGVNPFAGGQTVSGKTVQETRTDRVQPAFTVGQLDNKGDALPLTREDVP